MPSPPRSAEAEGACAGRSLFLASDRWRVKKGSRLNVHAAQPFDEDFQWVYQWTVSNGKVLAGHGTRRIEIKPGNQKTKGYINADGFVGVRLTVVSINEPRCSLTAETTIMVGKWGEPNGFPNVDSLELSAVSADAECLVANGPFIDVETKASDPENDVLSFVYKISTGKIIGQGSKVKWNLGGAPPGEHLIAVGVDDGYGISGRTVAKKIILNPCVN